MAKYKNYDYSQSLLIPFSLEDQLMLGTLEFAIHALMDGEHQVVVHAEAFGNGQDNQHLAQMIDGAKEDIKKIGQSKDYFENKIFTADSNYH